MRELSYNLPGVLSVMNETIGLESVFNSYDLVFLMLKLEDGMKMVHHGGCLQVLPAKSSLGFRATAQEPAG